MNSWLKSLTWCIGMVALLNFVLWAPKQSGLQYALYLLLCILIGWLCGSHSAERR